MWQEAKRVVYLSFLITLLVLLTFGCNSGGISITLPSPTFTSTYTPSPTVCPSIELPNLPTGAPPVTTNLWIIVFNPEAVSTPWRVAVDGPPMDFPTLIKQMLRRWAQAGDRVIFIRTGCRYFAGECWVCNHPFATPVPQSYRVPPTPTLIPTPLIASPTPLPKHSSLFRMTEQARLATATYTQIVPTLTEIATLNGCAREEWKRRYRATHDAFQATQVAEEQYIDKQVQQYLDGCWNTLESASWPTPYALQGTLLDALYQVSLILNQERGHYDYPRVLIFDEPKDWRVDRETGNIHDLSFEVDLSLAEVWFFLPNCIEEYDPPACLQTINIWRSVLTETGGAKAFYPLPNSRLWERIEALVNSSTSSSTP